MKLESIISDLVERGWSAQTDFFPHDFASLLKGEALLRHKLGHFRPANVGGGQTSSRQEEIRRDQIAWLTGELPMYPMQKSFLETFDALKTEINRALYLGIEEFEAHFAIYEAGGFYRRHFDRFHDDDRRVLSVVAYLNAEWRPEFGGQLKLYTSDGEKIVEPQAGTLVCFLSDKIEHEVIPAKHERWSIAGWMKRSGRRLPGL